MIIHAPIHSVWMQRFGLGLLVAAGLVCGCSQRPASDTPSIALQQGWEAFRLGDNKKAVALFDGVLATPHLESDHDQARAAYSGHSPGSLRGGGN